MLYTDYLKNLSGCPFCSVTNRILAENQEAFLTYSLAPYHEHHMLVVPKRHILKISELSESERRAIDELIMKAVRALEKLGMDHISILARDGKVTKDSNKTVDHLHYHVVSGVRIGSIDVNGEERKIMSAEEIDREMEEISAVLQ
jgi:diadenosine tetraphosphate (Ap4A) HIT family hydrolase